jgi:hypothetical protein
MSLSAAARRRKKELALRPKPAAPVLRSSYQFLKTQSDQNCSSILSRPCSHGASGARVRMDRWLKELDWTHALAHDLRLECSGVPVSQTSFDHQEVLPQSLWLTVDPRFLCVLNVCHHGKYGQVPFDIKVSTVSKKLERLHNDLVGRTNSLKRQ